MQRFEAHRIYSFHTFDAAFGQSFDHGLGDLALAAGPQAQSPTSGFDRHRPKPVCCWVPKRLRQALLDQHRDTPIFERQNKPRGADLYVPMQRLVSGELPARCKIHTLSEHARDFLDKGCLYERETPADERFGHQLIMRFPASAEQRVRAATAIIPEDYLYKTEERDDPQFIIPIAIVDVLIYQFSTNRLVCQVSLEAALVDDLPMTSTLLAEMVNHCGRFATLAWMEKAPSIQAPRSTTMSPRLIEMPSFTLGSLVARLILGARAESQFSFRTYTHAFAKIDPEGPSTTKAELSGTAARLARQYNDDYDLSSDAAGLDHVSDFENVSHAVAREGAATLVDPRTNGETVPFLTNYMSGALEPTYLPILVLNLHQLAQSLELNARSVLTTDDTGTLAELESRSNIDDDQLAPIIQGWAALQDDLAMLNTRFRFRHVGQISMHNSFNQALRRCFSLDELEEQLSRDLNEMSTRVETATMLRNQSRHKQFEKRFGLVRLFAAGVFVAIAGLQFLAVFHAFAQDGFSSWELVSVGAVCFLGLLGMVWFDFQNKQIS